MFSLACVGEIQLNKLMKDNILNCGLTFLLLLFSGCIKDEPEEVYLEGEPIAGVGIFFPLGFYDADPLMPKISPDGEKLLFCASAGLPEWEGLWVMDLETQERTLLYREGRYGDWSPNGEWIAFNIGTQIYKARKDGSELTQLTFEGRNFLPDWSPDGSLILYNNTSCGSQIDPIPENSCGVLTMDSNTNEKKLIASFVGTPKWFPSQDKFLTSGGEIFNLDGLKIYRLSLEEGYRSADINLIDERIIMSNSGGILVMNSNGEGLKRIIPSHLYGPHWRDDPEIYSACPSWHPDGKHIVYEHFEITRSKQLSDETHVEGYIRFYKVNVDSALKISNLSSY